MLLNRYFAVWNLKPNESRNENETKLHGTLPHANKEFDSLTEEFNRKLEFKNCKACAVEINGKESNSQQISF